MRIFGTMWSKFHFILTYAASFWDCQLIWFIYVLCLHSLMVKIYFYRHKKELYFHKVNKNLSDLSAAGHMIKVFSKKINVNTWDTYHIKRKDSSIESHGFRDNKRKFYIQNLRNCLLSKFNRAPNNFSY